MVKEGDNRLRNHGLLTAGLLLVKIQNKIILSKDDCTFKSTVYCSSRPNWNQGVMCYNPR